MMVVASAAIRARGYWPTVMPPMSVSAGRKVFSVTGGGDLAHPNQAARGLVDRQVMKGFEEVLRLQKVRYPIKSVVVDQYSAEQGLFRLDIVRRAPIGRSSGRRERVSGRSKSSAAMVLKCSWNLGGYGGGD